MILMAIGLAVLFNGFSFDIQAQEKSPSVLFLGTVGGSCSYEIANQLKNEGFRLNRMSYPGLTAHSLTWDQVEKYNVLVFTGLGKSNGDMTLSKQNKQTIEVMNRFLEEGGGILMLGLFGQQATIKPPQDAFLNPLGLAPIFDEMTVAPSDCEAGTSWNIPFSYTTVIPKSPISSGVKGLWFPVPEERVGAQNHMISFTCDKQWTIAVKGGKKSLTRKGDLQAFAPKDPGTYNSEVPLAALRQVAAGRIIYFGMDSTYIFSHVANTTLEGIVLKQGLLEKQSDGYRLISNSLKWLAEPSLASGTLGGAPMNKNMLKNPGIISYIKPFDWSGKPAFLPEEQAYPGVIGARSKYSSGKATVQEWADQAKKEKLSFIVFLEDFTKLTAEEFKNLKKECKELSTPEFALIPGFTIDDEIGNHYFYFGTAFAYPDKCFLSTNGKVFCSDDPELNPEYPKVKGQLSMTTLNYAYTKNGFKQTCGNFLFSKDAAPFANFFSNWDSIGVITSKNGKLLEDATDDYLQLVDFGQGPLPLAITLMDSPEELRVNNWRTVLHFPSSGGKMVGGFTVGDNSKIQDYFNLWHFYPDNPVRINITSGPEITYWGSIGYRDYEGNNNGNFVWQNYRWKLKGIVKSKVGLKKVEIYDGSELFREFLPEGKNEFTFDLDISHNKQHNLVLIVTDKEGEKAVSGEQWDRNHRIEEYNCADRNNQLSYGMIIRADNTWIKLGGNQTLASPNKRIDEKSISPSGTFKNDPNLGAPAFDGGAGGEPKVYAPVVMTIKGKETSPPSVSESFRLLHTGDVNIGEGRWEHYFTDNIRVANTWHTLWKTEPASEFTVTKRNHFFVPDPDSPLAVFLWEIKIKLKKDCLDNNFRISYIVPRESKVWTMRGSNGNVYTGNWEANMASTSRHIVLPFNPGAYGAFLDSPLGGAAVFSLTEGLTIETRLPKKSQIVIRLPKENSPTRKGDEETVRLLFVGVPRMTKYTRNFPSSSTETIERFRSDFGFKGKPAYKIESKAGLVTGTRYILDINGSKEKCFSGIISGKLISTLPIRVSGLNNNWSAFLYDRKMKKARPLGVFEEKAWATVIVNGTRDLFVGHPINVDNKALMLQLTQIGDKSWHLEVHNPTSQTIETEIHVNSFFDPLKGVTPGKITIPAGSSIKTILKSIN